METTNSPFTTEFKIQLIQSHKSIKPIIKKEQESESQLIKIKSKLESYLNSTTQFIWHTSKPILSINFDQEFIHGTLFYSDSIQDEWFLVWCLVQLSHAFPTSILISINDDDGEFLLIESADYLPKWITPHLSKGRVWIQSGDLHLIPLNHPYALDYQHDPLPHQIAFEIFKKPLDTFPTIASNQINQSIQLRLNQSTPDQLIQNHLYNTHAYLHRDISRVLRSNPNLIGLAIQAFMERDPQTFKVCQTMNRFPPNPISNQPNSSNQIKLSPLKLTRPLYASLLNHQQTFYPPKPFEKSQWFQSLDFHPSSKSSDQTQEFKRRLLGLKINCGFEILYHQELDSFQKYLNKLKSVGYFKSELKGSKEYNQLESKAKETFLNQKSSSISLIDLLESSLDQTDDSIDEMNFESESDEWLEINEEELQRLFKQDPPEVNDEAEDNSEKVTVEEERMAKEDVNKMISFAERMESFVNGQGSLEGALHSDDEHSSDEDDDQDSDDDDDDSEQEELRANLGDLKRNKDSRDWTQAKMSDYDDHQSKKRLESIVPSFDQTEWGSKSNKDDSINSNAQHPNDQSSNLKPKTQLFDLQSTSQSSISKPDCQSLKSETKLDSSGLTKESYDGVCDEETSEEEDDDDETFKMNLDNEMEMDIEMEMDTERDEFLNFAREALGLSEEQYQEILSSRKERGAYVPPPIKTKEKEPIETFIESERPQVDRKGKKSVRFHQEETPQESRFEEAEPMKVNEKLNDFESMMDAIESELEIQKTKKGGPIPNHFTGPNYQTENENEKDEEDEEDEEVRIEDLKMKEIQEMMKTELESIGLIEKDEECNPSEKECKMITGFLDSFNSQLNSNGPVGNLAGRIGIKMIDQLE
ncbi:uncharacterized protein MELLADRAFT_87105 [Melampsora larici-populina 98AG31]|uniref:SGT1-domain-containing protein n=1 Tax=Melampsora larici-populina (strain 98AG31 / pathotype 3-4-7) TaxID=747676 RepID=F4R4I6_MELLP|nr:uncharacterized protein MELLADRAFT_87105 [Melampsora larici-populina 98AG31]EGG12994.1 hypothetical protein MELLADRAFT_87105 [Melampsora larici-populina 98AG31]